MYLCTHTYTTAYLILAKPFCCTVRTIVHIRMPDWSGILIQWAIHLSMQWNDHNGILAWALVLSHMNVSRGTNFVITVWNWWEALHHMLLHMHVSMIVKLHVATISLLQVHLSMIFSVRKCWYILRPFFNDFEHQHDWKHFLVVYLWQSWFLIL